MTTQELDQLIYNTAVSDGMPNNLAKYIVAQAKHESGNYTSNFFKKYNNAFGYSYVKDSKWQLPEGGTIADNGAKIAAYKYIEDSIHELTDWIKRRRKEGNGWPDLLSIVSPQQYAALLKQFGYFQGALSVYSARLLQWYKTLSVQKKASVFF
jgi:hypothetical protein